MTLILGVMQVCVCGVFRTKSGEQCSVAERQCVSRTKHQGMLDGVSIVEE
jgi:hypothetical protein